MVALNRDTFLELPLKVMAALPSRAFRRRFPTGYGQVEGEAEAVSDAVGLAEMYSWGVLRPQDAWGWDVQRVRAERVAATAEARGDWITAEAAAMAAALARGTIACADGCQGMTSADKYRLLNSAAATWWEALRMSIAGAAPLLEVPLLNGIAHDFEQLRPVNGERFPEQGSSVLAEA